MLLNKEKESRVKFNPGLSANRPPNNWVQMDRCIFRYEIDEIGKNQDKSIKKNECVIDFYRLIDTMDINQITFTDFYRFID